MGVVPEGSGMAMDDDNMDDMEAATDGMFTHTHTYTHVCAHTCTHTFLQLIIPKFSMN